MDNENTQENPEESKDQMNQTNNNNFQKTLFVSPYEMENSNNAINLELYEKNNNKIVYSPEIFNKLKNENSRLTKQIDNLNKQLYILLFDNKNL